MKIKRAVKCTAIKKQLEEVIKIAEKADIHGLEVQEIVPLTEECPFQERGKIVIESCKKYQITSLVYHFPIRINWKDISYAKRFDLSSAEGKYIFNLTEDTIKEATLVGKALNIETEIPIVVHLFGFVTPEEIKISQRNKKFKLGEKRLIELKEIADYHSKKSGLKLVITRENNPPDCGRVSALLDLHPKDVIRTVNSGIGTNLDLAHLWLNIIYWKNGKGKFPWAELNKKLYPNINLKETIDELKSSLKLVHLSDSGPSYRQSFEGLEIGKGNFPHQLVIPLICSKLEKDIIGTYEIKYGHKDPESMLRSDKFYRKLFKKNFKEYFE